MYDIHMYASTPSRGDLGRASKYNHPHSQPDQIDQSSCLFTAIRRHRPTRAGEREREREPEGVREEEAQPTWESEGVSASLVNSSTSVRPSFVSQASTIVVKSFGDVAT